MLEHKNHIILRIKIQRLSQKEIKQAQLRAVADRLDRLNSTSE